MYTIKWIYEILHRIALKILTEKINGIHNKLRNAWQIKDKLIILEDKKKHLIINVPCKNVHGTPESQEKEAVIKTQIS